MKDYYKYWLAAERWYIYIMPLLILACGVFLLIFSYNLIYGRKEKKKRILFSLISFLVLGTYGVFHRVFLFEKE